MFKKVLYICLWLCVLSGTAATATPPSHGPALDAPSAPATINP